MQPSCLDLSRGPAARALVLALGAALAAGCRAATPRGSAGAAAESAPLAPAQDGAGPARPAPEPFPRPDPERTVGRVVRARGDSDWWLRLRLPTSVTFTSLDFDGDFDLDRVTTISSVPTLEAPIALSERWTLVPYAGLGGAYQNGDGELVGGDRFLWLLRGGVRAQRWQPFGERYALLTKGELQYDSVLGRGEGLLGDWSSIDAALELRRVFGEPGPGARLQPGVYALGLHFLEAPELELEGVSPRSIDDQLEVGLSFGTNGPARIGWFRVPRVYVGFLVGARLRAVRLRFGQL